MAKRTKKRGSPAGEYTGPDAESSDAPGHTPDELFLKRLRADFLADMRADRDWRREAKESSEFYDGKQWTDEEKEALRKRGQPDVTINRVKPRIDAISGIQQQFRVDTKAFPQGDRENEAAELSDWLRRQERDSNFDAKESLVFEDEIIDGRGWYKIRKCWDGLRAYHKVDRAYGEDVVKDRHSREADLSDAKRVSESVFTELEDAVAMFPDFESEIRASMDDAAIDYLTPEDPNRRVRPDQYRAGGSGDGRDGAADASDYDEFVNRDRRRVRLVTTYYRTKTAQKFLYRVGNEPIDVTDMSDAELAKAKESFPDGEVVTQWKKHLHSVTYCWTVVLEHKRFIREYDDEAKFPLVMVPAYTERKTYQHYGIIRQMKDPQREVNKRRSKLLFRLSVNQVRFEEGAFVESEDKARQEFVKPDGWIKMRPGSLSGGGPQVIVDKNLDMSQAEFAMVQMATKEVDEAAATKEVEGRSSANSGREYQLRQQSATSVLRKLLGNLRDARRQIALYLVDEYVKDQEAQAKLNGQPMDAMGNPVPLLTKYDVVVEEAPESLNLNSETFEQLVQAAQVAPALAQVIPPEMWLKLSPLPPRVKGEVMQGIQERQAMLQQAMQAQNAMETGGQPPMPPAA